jgi:hypothetical protein
MMALDFAALEPISPALAGCGQMPLSTGAKLSRQLNEFKQKNWNWWWGRALRWKSLRTKDIRIRWSAGAGRPLMRRVSWAAGADWSAPVGPGTRGARRWSYPSRVGDLDIGGVGFVLQVNVHVSTYLPSGQDHPCTLRIPSPGSTWSRTVRRAAGWMGSGVRVILRNERYRGIVHWNTSEWRKDPDTGKRKRMMRPRAEWITHVDESLRIVSDELWQRTQRRTQPAKDDVRLKSGGKAKYLLSGLLRCDVCGAHFTITGGTSYGCSSHHDGNACPNSIRVRRDRIEAVLLDPVNEKLIDPERIARIAKEMQDYYVERVRVMRAQAAEVPRELQELSARISRLKDRLRHGDPDLTGDELQAAIDRAEAKRRDVQQNQLEVAGQPPKVLAILPRAAELYRRQIARGLQGNPDAALKARIFLREWFGGKIRLEPLPDGGLVAHWNQNVAALLRGVGTCGSGGVISPYPKGFIRHRVR